MNTDRKAPVARRPSPRKVCTECRQSVSNGKCGCTGREIVRMIEASANK